ncbi:MAG TPA: NmrA family NAD(P)-binding protein [Spirillospora sp.]
MRDLQNADVAERHGLQPVIEAVAGADRIFLLNGYDVRMLAQSKAVIDAALAAGVSHIVHLGVHAAEDTTVVHFGWHQLIENYIERSGLAYVHLHPTTFMQNLLAPGTAASGVLTHYIGDGRPSWIDTDDIADVAAVVLRDPDPHEGGVYGLGTEVASMSEIAALLTEVTGRPWRDEPREPEDFYRTAVAAGADPAYMACVRNVFERTRDGSITETSETFDTVERLTGRPPTSLRAFVDKHRAAFT